MVYQTFVGYSMPNPIYNSNLQIHFVDNFIFKQVRAHLFAHNWMVSSISI